uniref:Uncharacterized protein n=1 Tax=Rhizophora mucronata TaxID=61149 RepID=A0A2P2LPB3_RHIMU
MNHGINQNSSTNRLVAEKKGKNREEETRV